MGQNSGTARKHNVMTGVHDPPDPGSLVKDERNANNCRMRNANLNLMSDEF